MDVKYGKWFLLFCLLLTFGLSLAGCQKQPEGVQVISYHLTKEQGNPDGANPVCAGMIGVPTAENCPVVFILHGAHVQPAGEQTPYGQGFSYLVQELADNGYLAISLEIGEAYSGESAAGDEYSRIKAIFQTTYEQLVAANTGGKEFACDLQGKADLHKINLIGHSRGGDNITRLAADPDFRGIPFVSALKIAAAGNSSFRGNYADLPTALLYSQYDEDVVDLDSANYYYYAYGQDEARRTPILSAYLYGANHGAYNTLVPPSNAVNLPTAATLLAPEDQRTFLKKFSLDFLNVYNKGASLFETFGNDFSQKYGIDCMLSIHDPAGSRILAPKPWLAGLTGQGLDLSYVVSSIDPLKNTAKPFHPPGTRAELPLYRLTWEKAGGSFRIPCDGIFYQLTPEKIMGFYWALDSGDPRNLLDAPTTFDLVFTDQNGAKVTIPYSSATSAALKYQPGKLLKEEGMGETWQAFTPLGTDLLPLSGFDNPFMIDNLISLELVPTSNSGALMLGGIDLYPAAVTE